MAALGFLIFSSGQLASSDPHILAPTAGIGHSDPSSGQGVAPAVLSATDCLNRPNGVYVNCGISH
jgi:hypothetical protein